VSAHTRRVLAAEVTEAAPELDAAPVVDVPHVPLHVRLVHALVSAKVTLKHGGPRILLAGELHVPLQQTLELEGGATVRTDVGRPRRGPFLLLGRTSDGALEAPRRIV
jgi:hypothetical protein